MADETISDNQTKKDRESKAARRRMDFAIEVIDGDRELQTVRVRMTPAPRRYSLIEIGGKDFYFDKFLQEAISLDEFAKQAAGLPIYYMPPSIESSHDYASARVSPVQQEINTGVHTPPLEKAAAHKPPLR